MLGYLSKKGKEIFKDLRLFEKLMPNILDSENQHIYITSKEVIQEGDWVYIPNKTIMLVTAKYATESSFMIGNSNHEKSPYYIEFCRKIILTTDQDLIKDGVQSIDDEFLEWFIENPSCESVEVELDYDCGLRIIDGKNLGCYSIIIPKKEPKQETLEEAKQSVQEYEQQGLEKYSYELQQQTLEDAAEKFINNTRLQNRKVLFMEGAKWQQEQILNFLYEEITERRPYSASKMCEKVIEFIKKNDR